jgi:hypothetical protein
MALEAAPAPPRTTVFAGRTRRATQRAREYFTGYAPSSPAIALLKDGELVFMLERWQIEGRSGRHRRQDLAGRFDEHPPAPAGDGRLRNRRRTGRSEKRHQRGHRRGGPTAGSPVSYERGCRASLPSRTATDAGPRPRREPFPAAAPPAATPTTRPPPSPPPPPPRRPPRPGRPAPSRPARHPPRHPPPPPPPPRPSACGAPHPPAPRRPPHHTPAPSPCSPHPQTSDHRHRACAPTG